MIDVYNEELKTHLNMAQIYECIGDSTATLLESSKHEHHLGDFSILGFNTLHEFSYDKGQCCVDNNVYSGDLFEELRKFCNTYKVENTTDLPFIGGVMGFLNYDIKDSLEKLDVSNDSIVDLPLCYFRIYNDYIVMDHIKEQMYYLSLRKSHHWNIMKLSRCIEQYEKQQLQKKEVSEEPEHLSFVSPYTQQSYMDAVENMRGYIKKGHMYIANMTHTFVTDTTKDPLNLYMNLRQVNPAPFSAYFPLREGTILSSSPERFLRVNNGQVETKPIKGTRPRYKDLEEDSKSIKELLNSEKDKSELLMIVDLERNDLSRVCVPGTVVVEDLFQLQSYETVHHLVATVKGQLAEEYDIIDLLQATFPGGSITGAPKIRAMEIIDELEEHKRGFYTGCLGYIGFDGCADFNILIRSILMKDKKAYIGVGGGITYESDPLEEYEETLTKAKALFKALSL